MVRFSIETAESGADLPGGFLVNFLRFLRPMWHVVQFLFSIRLLSLSGGEFVLYL